MLTPRSCFHDWQVHRSYSKLGIILLSDSCFSPNQSINSQTLRSLSCLVHSNRHPKQSQLIQVSYSRSFFTEEFIALFELLFANQFSSLLNLTLNLHSEFTLSILCSFYFDLKFADFLLLDCHAHTIHWLVIFIIILVVFIIIVPEFFTLATLFFLKIVGLMVFIIVTDTHTN